MSTRVYIYVYTNDILLVTSAHKPLNNIQMQRSRTSLQWYELEVVRVDHDDGTSLQILARVDMVILMS